MLFFCSRPQRQLRHFVSHGKQPQHAHTLSAERLGPRGHQPGPHRIPVHRARRRLSVFVRGLRVRGAPRMRGSHRGDVEVPEGQHGQSQTQDVRLRRFPVRDDAEGADDDGPHRLQRDRQRGVQRGLRHAGAVVRVPGVLRREDQAHVVLVDVRGRARVAQRAGVEDVAALRQDRTLQGHQHGVRVQPKGECAATRGTVSRPRRRRELS